MSEPSDSRRLNLRESLLKFLETIGSQPGKEDSASHVSAARQERGESQMTPPHKFAERAVRFTETGCCCSSSDDPSLAFAGGSGAALLKKNIRSPTEKSKMLHFL